MKIARWMAAPILAAGLFGQGYSPEDRQAAINELDESVRVLALMTENMTVAQSTFTPDNRWSTIQVIEHLARIEDMLFGQIKKMLEGAPGEEQAVEQRETFDKLILRAVADRSQKAQAPEGARPEGTYRDLDQARMAFGQRRGNVQDWVRANKLPLRKYRAKAPLGEMDAHQYLLMLAAHTRRHALQIEELKLHPLFPKRE